MAFLITKDIENAGTEFAAVGTVGPRNARDEIISRLKNGEGEKFRMLDDDRNLYFEGLFIDDGDAEGWDVEVEFQPLDAFGRPDSGCTIIQYKGPNGEWEDL